MSQSERETYNQLGLKQKQNIEYKIQHTNTNTIMLWTKANQLIEIVNESCD